VVTQYQKFGFSSGSAHGIFVLPGIPPRIEESMPWDKPRNLINTQVHESKLSRQSIMYVAMPQKSRLGLGLVVGVWGLWVIYWGWCLETPHKYLVYFPLLSPVCEVAVPASLNACHTRFNWLLYLWLQFASLLCFLIKCALSLFGPTCAVIEAIAKPN